MQLKCAEHEIVAMKNEELLVHQEVQKNEEFYRDLFIEALDGIVFWTIEDGIIEANESACKIFESSESELKHKKIEDFVFSHPSNYNRILKDLYSKGSIRDELVFLMPNGQKKILEFTTKLHSANGHRMTIFRNVTERYEMEQELRESERKFRSIFEGAVEGLILWNDKFEIVDVNSAGEKLFHANKEEIIGRCLLSILSRNNVKEEDMSEHVDLFKSKEHSCGVLTLVSGTGERMHVEYSTKKNVFSNLNMSAFKDITEKLQMEEHLRKSDTLSVIGQLAAGIAHEIRNPMTALKGFIQLLEDTIQEDHAMYFGVIKNELNRIDSIINEFLVLAKPQAMKYLEKDIAQLMKETIELLQPQAVLHNVQFQLEFEKDIPFIYCEPNQLKKVFINIIKNAIEVMSNGGFIRITIRKMDGALVMVSIKDEGEGIEPEKLRRLGEPFFTTKEKGTGLGLMVSYKIISEHQGSIEVESEKGNGTVFHIKLPIGRV
ncbi:PAS domain-containing sensor histidine kinase [Robertmurraya sp. Marseille-Q9965]